MRYLPVIIASLYATVARAQGFKLDSPITGVKTLGDLIDKVSANLIQIAIPIAVLMYIWAGITFMTSQWNPDGISKAKKIMLYTTIGFVIILIGRGFVDLIGSFLGLG